MLCPMFIYSEMAIGGDLTMQFIKMSNLSAEFSNMHVSEETSAHTQMTCGWPMYQGEAKGWAQFMTKEQVEWCNARRKPKVKQG